jgi:hypothetical protein
MAEQLGIDYRIVLAAVRQLLEEGKVEEESRGPLQEIPA